MGYKTFVPGVSLSASDIQTYLMNQAVITCTSGTHPANPPEGMVIFETDNNAFLFCSNIVGPVWSPLNTHIAYQTSTAATSNATTSAVKDGGPGDLAFSVTSTSTVYRVRYIARAQTDAASSTVDFQIRDGGSSSPTNASPIVAAASTVLTITAGAGAIALVCEGIGTFTVGTHTIAGFYVRTSGSGNITVAQSTGGQRILSVEALT